MQKLWATVDQCVPQSRGEKQVSVSISLVLSWHCLLHPLPSSESDERNLHFQFKHHRTRITLHCLLLFVNRYVRFLEEENAERLIENFNAIFGTERQYILRRANYKRRLSSFLSCYSSECEEFDSCSGYAGSTRTKVASSAIAILIEIFPWRFRCRFKAESGSVPDDNRPDFSEYGHSDFTIRSASLINLP